MSPPLRVAVVGGGWAGLAAAVELSAVGTAVTVFEASRQLGGRARSVEIEGHRLDNGQHILIGAYSETLRLMRQVEAPLRQGLLRLPLQLDFPEGGKDKGFRLRLPKLPAPLHLVAGLLGARGVGYREKLSAAVFMRRLQAQAYRLEEDCSVASLLDRHEQQGTLRHHLWEALCLAALNTSPTHASAQVFAKVLEDSLGGGRAATDLLLPRVDLEQLFPAPAAAYLGTRGGEIRRGHRVGGIENGAAGLQIDGESFDHVIVALAPQHAGRLLETDGQTAETARLLSTYRYEAIGTAYLGYPPEVALPFPMLGMAAGTVEAMGAPRFGQWVFDRGRLDGNAGLLAFVLSGNGEWDTQEHSRLAQRLHDELEQVLGHPLPPPRWSRVIRERRATFSCRPGLPRPTTRTRRRGLWLAGDYVCADYPATLEGAVRSGVAAARAILQETIVG